MFDCKKCHEYGSVYKILRHLDKLYLLAGSTIEEKERIESIREMTKDIVKYKRMFGDDCYNIAKGDVNTTEFNPAKLPEVRKKIKDKIKKGGGLKGKNNPMYGKHWSKRKREQMMFMFNNNHPMIGRKHSEETKKHWSSIVTGKQIGRAHV